MKKKINNFNLEIANTSRRLYDIDEDNKNSNVETKFSNNSLICNQSNGITLSNIKQENESETEDEEYEVAEIHCSPSPDEIVNHNEKLFNNNDISMNIKKENLL